MIKRNKFKIILFLVLAFLALRYIYPYSPYKVEFLGFYDDKIWAHRANSKEKLASALNYYKGVELDLVYDATKNNFDVNHTPAISINLTFEDYLNTLDNKQQPYLWLDLKNLRLDNAREIYTKLEAILSKKEYPITKILIETRYPDALPMFTKAGYITSYYLPYNLIGKQKEDLDAELLKISNVLKKQPEIGISTNHIDYEVIKKHFPDKPKYIWALVRGVNKDFLKTRRLLKDKTVKVVLVNYKALKGNR